MCFFSFSLGVDEADLEAYGDIEGEENDIPEVSEALEETGGLLAEEPEASEVPEPEPESGETSLTAMFLVLLVSIGVCVCVRACVYLCLC